MLEDLLTSVTISIQIVGVLYPCALVGGVVALVLQMLSTLFNGISLLFHSHYLMLIG